MPTTRFGARRASRASVGAGRQTWVRTYKRPGTLASGGEGLVYGFAICAAKDGGVFFLAHTAPTYGVYDSTVMKLGPQGQVEWQRTLKEGLGLGVTQFLQTLNPTADGGAIAGGEDCVLKFSPVGDIEWQRIYAHEGGARFRDVQQTGDGGYLLLGATGPSDAHDILLVKLDAGGAPVWEQTYDGLLDEMAHGFLQTADGGILVCGTAVVAGGARSLLLLKLSSSGDVEWQAAYGGFDFGVDSIAATSDGGAILAGTAYETGASTRWDPWAVKINGSGGIDWATVCHGALREALHSITQTADGGFVAAGSTDSFSTNYDEKSLLVKFAPTGDIEWQQTYGGAELPLGWNSARSVAAGSDGAIFVGGTGLAGGMGGSRCFLLKTSDEAQGMVERLPGLAAAAGLEVQPVLPETVPFVVAAMDTTITVQAAQISPVSVTLKGGLVFAPPAELTASTLMTRSLALADYAHELSWRPNPANDDLEISKYRIYSLGPLPQPDPGDLWPIPGPLAKVEEVDGRILQYYNHHVETDGRYEYAVWGVTVDGSESAAIRVIYPASAGAARR